MSKEQFSILSTMISPDIIILKNDRTIYDDKLTQYYIINVK